MNRKLDFYRFFVFRRLVLNTSMCDLGKKSFDIVGQKLSLVKVVIVNEELTLDEAKETKGNWKEDWDGYVLRAIDDNEPCYLLYRFVF